MSRAGQSGGRQCLSRWRSKANLAAPVLVDVKPGVASVQFAHSKPVAGSSFSKVQQCLRMMSDIVPKTCNIVLYLWAVDLSLWLSYFASWARVNSAVHPRFSASCNNLARSVRHCPPGQVIYGCLNRFWIQANGAANALRPRREQPRMPPLLRIVRHKHEQSMCASRRLQHSCTAGKYAIAQHPSQAAARCFHLQIAQARPIYASGMRCHRPGV